MAALASVRWEAAANPARYRRDQVMAARASDAMSLIGLAPDPLRHPQCKSADNRSGLWINQQDAIWPTTLQLHGQPVTDRYDCHDPGPRRLVQGRRPCSDRWRGVRTGQPMC